MFRQTIRGIVRNAIRTGGLYLSSRLPRTTVSELARALPLGVRGRLRNIIFSRPASEPEAERPLKDLVLGAIDGVADLDAELGWFTSQQILTLPVIRPLATLNIHRLFFELMRKIGTRPRFMVLLNALTHGGADLYAVSIFKALCAVYGPDAVAFVVTDQRIANARDWLPQDARIVFLDDLQPGLDLDTKRYLLIQMISTARPQAVFNVNSRLIWDYIVTYGAPLSAFTSLYSTMFCYEFRSDGVRGGYAAFNFRDGLIHHAGILFDNDTFRQELIAEYAVPTSMHDRLRTLYTPLQSLEDHTEFVPDAAKRNVVLWAGRFVFQKLPLLAIAIARLCPEYEFHIHGEGDSELTASMKANAPSNVTFFGRFRSMESLLRQGYGLMLYTSVTDGVPTVIQGAARFGVSVVASATGGISELVRPDTGWLVEQAEDPAAYAKAIREAMTSPAERNVRASKMKDLVLRQHDPQRFASDLRAFVEETSHDPI